MQVRGWLEGWLSLSVPSFTYKLEGEYACGLRIMDGQKAIQVLLAIDDLLVQAKDKFDGPEVKQFCPYEIDGRTLVLKFKAPGVRWFHGKKVTYNLPLVNETGQVDDSLNDITAGSEVTVSFNPRGWSADFGYGVSLQMDGVMVHKPVHLYGREPDIPEVTNKY